MKKSTQILALACFAILLQACSTSELVTSPEDLNGTDPLVVQTRGGREILLQTWDRDTSGSLLSADENLEIPVDSIATIEIRKPDHLKTLAAVVGASATAYVVIRLAVTVGRLVQQTRDFDVNPFWLF